MTRTYESILEYNREYYRTHKQHWDDKRHDIRKQVLILLGNKCAQCGNTDERVLQIDHPNGDGTQDTFKHRTNGVAYGKHILRTYDGTNYQLLCANCNIIKKYENNEHSYRLDQGYKG